MFQTRTTWTGVLYVVLACLLGVAACQGVGGSVLEQSVPSTPSFETIDVEDTLTSPIESDRADRQDCPNVDSVLVDLVRAPDPLGVARQLGFKVHEGKIQVLVVLDQQDLGFLEPYGVEAGSRSGDQVQAFVPPGQLCALATADQVIAIRALGQASIP